MVSAGKSGHASASKNVEGDSTSPARNSASESSSARSPPAILLSPRHKPRSSGRHGHKSHHSHRPHHPTRTSKSGHTSEINNRESIYYLNSGDHPGALMVSDKLVGESNYPTWANAMRLSLLSRRKIAFINGKVKKPEDISGREHEAWEIVNGLVLSWIINSVSPQIASTLMHTEDAHTAWTDLLLESA